MAVLELLPTSTPGGGPKQVYDLVRELPKGEFEVVVGAPRDGIFFERFQALGLVPPNDSAVLTEAILSLISNPVRRRAMGEVGWRRALEEFGIRLMVDATAAVFRRARAPQPSRRDADDV